MNILHIAQKALIFCLVVTSFPIFAQSGTEPVVLKIKNEEEVNSKGLEFSPTFYEDGIVFISTNSAGAKKNTDDNLKMQSMTILRSRRNEEGILGKPEVFAKELTTKFNEGPVCFDQTTDMVFFSSNNNRNGREVRGKDGRSYMNLFFSKKIGEAWSEPLALPFNSKEFSDYHPSISIDGDKLFFSSNRPGGFGGRDLYVSFRIGDSWSEPINLGAKINTPGNEAFPFIHADNTLYYASDGHPGQGGLDIFYAIPDGSEWTKPINIGSPFNTKGDDFGLITDLDKINGYFSTNGNGGKGGDDIFSFHLDNGNLDDFLFQNNRLIERDLDVLITAFDIEDGKPLVGATVNIINMDQSNVIGRDSAGNLITLQNVDGQDIMKVIPQDKGVTGKTDAGGRFSSTLNVGNYAFILTKEGYQTKQIIQKITKPGNELVASLSKASGKIRWNAVLFNDQTNAPLSGATLVLTNEITGEKDTITTDANGAVDYYLDANTGYSVEISQNGRFMGATQFNTSEWKNDGSQQKMTLNISGGPLSAGSVIELPNIYYNYNDATLHPDARKDLDLLLAILQQYPAIVLELASHTDSRGTNEYNQDLSDRRANNVVNYLNAKGVALERLKPVGYGETMLRNNCKDDVECSDKEHAKNRRTEIKVLAGANGAKVVLKEGKLAQDGGKVNQAPSNVVINNDSNLDYFVIAGSFLMENRANAQKERLVNAGYGGTEIVQFPKSPFYSVVAAKVGSMDDAQMVKKMIETKENMNAFIKPVPKQ